jgi:hypothetical protein
MTFLPEPTLGLNLRRTSEGRPLAFKKTTRSTMRKTAVIEASLALVMELLKVECK